MATIIAQKPSIQLEGHPIYTEISDIVYEQLVNSNNKYVQIDSSAHSITIKRSFFKKNKQVQNVTRFFIEANEEEVIIYSPIKNSDILLNSSFDDSLIESNFKNKTIAIILESPHIDEYESNAEKLIPIGPAQGQTGKKIEKNIEKLIERLRDFHVIEDNHLYRINIINAVNFQTSLHYIHEKPLNNYYRELRDKIWLKMWSEIPQIKNEFLKHTSSLKKGSIIINACPKSLKPFVNLEYIQNINKYHLFESNHPTSTENWVDSLFKIN